MKSPTFIIPNLLLVALLCLIIDCSATAAEETQSQDVPKILSWSGDYPVTGLNLLPEGQEEAKTGFISNKEDFAAVWKFFKPADGVPEIDFDENLVIFTRNVVYFNRVSIARVTLKGGIIEILSMETRSARPIEDKVAMAMAVIPRDGIRFIETGKLLIPVPGSNG